MMQFDRACMTFYWSAVVTIAVSCTIFELLDVEYYRDFEIWLRGHSRSLKLVPFESVDYVSYSPSIITMAVPFVRYSASKTGMTLKTELGFVHGHWKWHHLIDCI